MAKPWSFEEDIMLLSGMKITGRSERAIKLRKAFLKDTTIDRLMYEELFIKTNCNKLSALSIAEILGHSETAIYRRIQTIKSDVDYIVEVEKEVKVNNIIVEPMKKVMIVKYDDAPKGSLSRKEIQEDRLEKGKTYNIITLQRGDRRSSLSKKTKMQLLECYPNHYLFEEDAGRKHSLMKVDYHLGEWKYEEVSHVD